VVGGFLLSLGPAAARAEVLFQNTGNKLGWGRLFTQKAGTIDEVSSPVYKGTTAVKTTQTYQSSDGQNYHSEIIKTMAQLAGQDLYYGQAIYLPPDWVFHSQNVTFQQWAPENPEAPWILMFLQGDKVRLGGRGANGDKDVGRITDLRGTWIRVVTRIHMATGGAFEVWINGQRFFSQNGNFRAQGPSLRWSSGIYCTRWDTETPTGPRQLTIFHDSLRIATTLAEADPANWGDGDAPPPADAGAGADAATERPAAQDAAGDAGATGAGGGAAGSGGSGTGGASGGASGGAGAGGATGGSAGAGTGASPGTGRGGAGGAPPASGGAGGDDPTGPARGSSSGIGCRLGGGARDRGPGCLAAGACLVLALVRGRRRRRRRARPPR
jgi:hypothetical protein